MIFNGVFNDLTVQQCVALLSCFVFEEKVRIQRKMVIVELSNEINKSTQHDDVTGLP